ncbi:YigZ family protein [uncultured Bifidobacterium sp.]|uniref:IMPACT family protein n=1 Tax=uncultured Bifidobacterium sp. TaxID=165187 RepID=UPI0028DB7BEB|nr:YigZ family protein [uncultured Bifidobacterium sp.]
MTDGSTTIHDSETTGDSRGLGTPDGSVLTVLPISGGPEAAEYDQRRSRFLGYAFPMRSADQMAGIVSRIRHEHDGARHVVHAAVLAGDGTESRSVSIHMNDDGEPSGTAARPILDVLRARRIENGLVVVVRYFGGVLLGAPGLVRAYSAAASAALDQARLAALVPFRRYHVILPYAFLDQLDHLATRAGGHRESCSYSDHVEGEVVVPDAVAKAFSEAVVRGSAGRVVPEDRGVVREAVPLPEDDAASEGGMA